MMFPKPGKKPKKARDTVGPRVRALVLARDRMCFGYRVDRQHVCRDTWGRPHSPYALELLTVEHVKDELRMGVRAKSDARHLLAACYALNVGVPSKDLRDAMRAYLAGVSS